MSADPTKEIRWRWKWDDAAQDWSAQAIEGGSRKKKKETTENIDPLSPKGIDAKVDAKKKLDALPLTSEEQSALVAKFPKLEKTLGKEGALAAINAGLKSSNKELRKIDTPFTEDMLEALYETFTPDKYEVADTNTFNADDVAETMRQNPDIKSKGEAIQLIKKETGMTYSGR